MIADTDIEKALDWLRDSAKQIGAAKEKSIRAGHMLKHVKALMMKQFNEMPVAAQQREAEASDAYRKALEADAIAAGEYETLKSLREAAALKIEVWRSEQANFRALKI